VSRGAPISVRPVGTGSAASVDEQPRHDQIARDFFTYGILDSGLLQDFSTKGRT
jgi:hypothetical protein